ncbi:MAG: AMP-binding protein [Verrucomicrobia bacterium]|nr:AMP-binding protein [Verrucomicrobiota bacterium]MDA1065122.1 AMP-binding protein [Verrucomicrobiota bacterium]
MRNFPKTLDALLAVPFLTQPDWAHFSKLVNDLAPSINPGDQVLVAQEDRLSALAAFFTTVIGGGSLFMANPHWGTNEWKLVGEQTSFNKIFGNAPGVNIDSQATHSGETRIMIPSGGTSGGVRFCVHSLETLTAAVQSLFEFHGEKPLNSINTLGVFHVSGLMPVVRACLSGGLVQLTEWKTLVSGDFPLRPGDETSISLVPTQLVRLIQADAGLNFLHGLDAIYLGGASATPNLVNFIRTEKLPVLFVYGMTETAAMVVIGSRADTDASGNIWGRPLPGVSISLSEDLEISVKTKALFHGYFPVDSLIEEHATGDTGRWTVDKQLQVTGRKDYLINTGGEKVNPLEVEALISEKFPDLVAAVSSRPSEQWGEEVVAVFEEELTAEKVTALQSFLANWLSPYKIPKTVISGKAIPRSLLGKINRAALKTLLHD